MQQLTKLNVASRTATADIGQATMPLAAFREIELGTLEIGLGTLKTAPAAQSFGRGLAYTSIVADAADKPLDGVGSESVTNTVRRHTPACKRACGTEHPQHPLLHPLDEIRVLASCLEDTPPAQASNDEANGLGHDSKHLMFHSYSVRILLQPLAVTLRVSSRTPLATPWKLAPNSGASISNWSNTVILH